MQHYLLTLLTTGLLCLTLTAHAQISLDGTLGKSGALSGPNYQIGADLGQQHGGNLFHSFRDFNLQSHESATFSGPDNVQNIISRVTGGNPSSIDGTLRSTIPNADMYFLNPYGIMFGKNAKLDVQGGFHASTADYLRLQDGGRFEARVPGNSLLTVAPVAAFGFLTEAPGEIRLQDSKLSVPEGKTLSLIGGGLEINGSTPPTYDDYGIPTYSSSWLFAPSGRLNLASVASRGEVIPTLLELDLNTQTKAGHISTTNTLLTVSGKDRGGDIFIRGGQFELTNSLIDNTTFNQAAGVTDIQVDNLTLRDGAFLNNSTYGIGQGSSINLKVTEDLTIVGTNKEGNYAGIYANSFSTMPWAGNAGNLTIQARQVNLTDGAQITSLTNGAGQGGTIHLRVFETLTASGRDAKGLMASGIGVTSKNKNLEKAGNAGSIEIEARQMVLTKGGTLSSSTLGTGQGGSIILKVADTLTLTGTNQGGNSGIYANSEGTMPQAGNAGQITIQARQVNLTDGTQITSFTNGTGQGGTIYLQVSDILTVSGQDTKGKFISGISANSRNNTIENAGNAGNVEIEARQIVLTNGGVLGSETYGTGRGGSIILKGIDTLTVSGNTASRVVSGISVTSGNQEIVHAGDAGNMKIEARQINLTEYGFLSSGTLGAGKGGNVVLRGVDTLNVNELSAITSLSGGSKENSGNAGEVLIEARQVMLTDSGKIITGTNNAGGGNITITTPNLLYLRKGAIATNVQAGTGKGGNITIQRPVFVVLDGAEIVSKAKSGTGGDIIIDSKQMLVSSGQFFSKAKPGSNGNVFIISGDGKNILDATSDNLENSGKIVITATPNNLGSTVTILPATLKNYEIVKQRCTAEKIADRSKRSKFVKTGRGGVSDAPTQLRSGSVMDITKEQLW